MDFTLRKSYVPYASPHDPCPPIYVKTYVTHPALYVGYQPPGLPQFPPYEALRTGTLWPIFYDPYGRNHERQEGET
ncbi:CotJA protein [[Clostridium] ultunense Esp]|uniref:spore coat associated protein CotJA n=1 Tax=Thermicanus aegyptius TaxID=94009 RepID=UPI0002B70B09|nr:spore coat associated protein CotJA [Thermicanus aegyptius]CCQ92387.1 CotJA protein [[Clostridium] ultunense Esp]